MKFKQHATVITSEGKEVGRIDRVVVDPNTKEVTHVVVRKGFLFTEDKVVPISLIKVATDEGVTLREDLGDLQDLPVFGETHYVSADEDGGSAGGPPPLYWYQPIGDFSTVTHGVAAPPRYITEIKTNIPDETVAVSAGAKVISADDKHVGNVEQILTDPQADRMTHLVISKGLLLKERKLVPASWVRVMSEEQVYLAVGSRLLEALHPYQN
jgi:uncharacterized protein YrrD